MSFSFVINGNTWQDTDFGPTNYARSLPLFLQDVVTDNRNKFGPLTSNTFDMFTAGQVFTLGGGFPASAWMKIGAWIVCIPELDKTQWVVAQITAFAGSNYTMTPIAQSKNTTLGGVSQWRVCLTPILTAAISSATGANGGTGATTVAAANAITIQGELSTRNEEFFDDFISAILTPPVGSTSVAQQFGRSPYTFSIPTEANAYDTGAQVTNQFFDPNHPGVFGLNVSANTASVKMSYGAASITTGGSLIWRSGVGMTVETCIRVPLLGGSGNDFQFQLGLTGFNGSSTNALQWNYDSSQALAAQKWTATATATGVTTTGTLGVTHPLPQATWVRLKMQSIVGGGVNFLMNDAIVQTFGAGATPSNTSSQTMYWYARLAKITGNIKRSLLLDYLYIRNSASR